MERFSGRVAVVTGASSGIGAEIAKDLALAGLVVVGVARREDRLQALSASLRGKGQLHSLRADLSSVDEVRRVFRWVDDNLGGVAVLVNNAAFLSTGSYVEADAVQSISLNLTAVAVASQEALKSMQKHGIKDGHIINMNSISGHVVMSSPSERSATMYTATKQGLRALSKGLRFDIQKMPGFQTRVTNLCPGGTRTDMLPEEYLSLHSDVMPLLKVENISNAVMYALSCPPTVEISDMCIQPVGEKM